MRRLKKLWKHERRASFSETRESPLNPPQLQKFSSEPNLGRRTTGGITKISKSFKKLMTKRRVELHRDVVRKSTPPLQEKLPPKEGYEFSIKIWNLRCRSLAVDDEYKLRFSWDSETHETHHILSRDPVWPEIFRFVWRLPCEVGERDIEQAVERLNQRPPLRIEVYGKRELYGEVRVALGILATGPLHHDLAIESKSGFCGGRIIFGLRMAQRCTITVSLVQISLKICEPKLAVEKKSREGELEVCRRPLLNEKEFQVAMSVNPPSQESSSEFSTRCRNFIWDSRIFPDFHSQLQTKKSVELLDKSLPRVFIDTCVTNLRNGSILIQIRSRNQAKSVKLVGESYVSCGKLYNSDVQWNERFSVAELEEDLWLHGQLVGRLSILLVSENNPIFHQLQAGVHTGEATFSWMSPILLESSSETRPTENYVLDKTPVSSAHKIFEAHLGYRNSFFIVPQALDEMVSRIGEIKSPNSRLPSEIRELAYLQQKLVKNQVHFDHFPGTTKIINRMSELLKKTNKSSMLSFVYKRKEDLLQAQGVLLHLANLSIHFYKALNSFEDQRLFAQLLSSVLSRGELDVLGLIPGSPQFREAVYTEFSSEFRDFSNLGEKMRVEFRAKTLPLSFIRLLAIILRNREPGVVLRTKLDSAATAGVSLEKMQKFSTFLTEKEQEKLLWYDTKMHMARFYRNFIFRLSTLVVEHLDHLHLWESPQDFAPQLLARLYFVWPDLRQNLLDTLLTDDEKLMNLPEWRGMTFKLNENLALLGRWREAVPQGLRQVLDWQTWHDVLHDYFFLTWISKLHEDEDVNSAARRWCWISQNRTEIQALGAITSLSWRRRLQRKGTVFFVFLRQFSIFVGRTVVNNNLFCEAWQYLPGYAVLVKALLLAVRQRSVENYPDILVNSVGSMLRNRRLLPAIVKIMFKSTNVHKQQAVMYSLDNFVFWIKAMNRFGLEISSDFDWPFVTTAFDRLLSCDLSKNIANCLYFLYSHFHVIEGPYTEHLLLHVVLEKHFYSLILHWSPIVRQRYFLLLFFRYYDQHLQDGLPENRRQIYFRCFRRLKQLLESLNLENLVDDQITASWFSLQKIERLGIFRRRVDVDRVVREKVRLEPRGEEAHEWFRQKRVYFQRAEEDLHESFSIYLKTRLGQSPEPEIGLLNIGGLDSEVEDYQDWD